VVWGRRFLNYTFREIPKPTPPPIGGNKKCMIEATGAHPEHIAEMQMENGYGGITKLMDTAATGRNTAGKWNRLRNR
jgi:hypothetical protein